MDKEPLIDEQVLLEKFPGKGGWTYATLPERALGPKKHFGWQKANVFIDDYEIEQCSLMPMGKGRLFIAVKAEIRKVIKKQAGDFVHIKLYASQQSLPVQEDFMLCLHDEPEAEKRFLKLSDTEQQQILDWIYEIQTEKIIVDRMASVINKLALNLPIHVGK
jgi:hypothetical protein